MSAPEVRWCEDSGMVLRRCSDGTWAVLDVVSEADDVAVVTATRLVPPDQLHREAEDVAAGLRARWAWSRARQRRSALLSVLAFAVGVALGAPLGRWSR